MPSDQWFLLNSSNHTLETKMHIKATIHVGTDQVYSKKLDIQSTNDYYKDLETLVSQLTKLQEESTTHLHNMIEKDSPQKKKRRIE